MPRIVAVGSCRDDGRSLVIERWGDQVLLVQVVGPKGGIQGTIAVTEDSLRKGLHDLAPTAT